MRNEHGRAHFYGNLFFEKEGNLHFTKAQAMPNTVFAIVTVISNMANGFRRCPPRVGSNTQAYLDILFVMYRYT